MKKDDIWKTELEEDIEEILTKVRREEDYEVGCTGCGAIVASLEMVNGYGCPHCGDTNLLTFQEAIAALADSRNFLDQLGMEYLD